MKKPVEKKVKEISFRFLLAALLFLAAIFVFALIAHEIVGEKEDEFDTKVFQFLKPITSSNLISLAKTLSYFGSTFFLVIAYLLLITVLFLKNKRSDAINIAIIAITSTVLMFALKSVYHRHRPQLPLLRELKDFSFPSGHALSSFIFCSVLIYVAWQSNMSKTWKYFIAVFLILFSIAIGLSRIVLRYHYASDVLAGFFLGFAWVILSFWSQRKLIHSS